MHASRRPSWLAVVLALAALTGLGYASLRAVEPPPPAGTDAPATAFSAARAAEHVRRIAAEPHVAGSAEGDAVRAYLLEVLRDLGLDPVEQDAVGIGPNEDLTGVAVRNAARARNVAAVLPGADPSRPVFLVAHYDSVQAGPGANDDAAGVAVLLETARALAAGPPLRNDVVLLFTDAEEACLCGAEAFVSQHPLAALRGAALNVEARGTAGPVVTFETSANNEALVRQFGRAAPHPVGTSFAVEIYRLLPRDTDFSAFRRYGFAGLNAAYLDGSAAYHTPEDSLERLGTASLQAHGDNALATVSALGNTPGLALSRLIDAAAERPSPDADATYFPTPLGLTVYPGWLVLPLALLAVMAVATLVWQARRRGLLTVSAAAAGLSLSLVPLLLGAAAAQGLWRLLVVLRPGYAGMLDPWQPLAFRWGVVALVATLLLAWYGLLRRRVGPDALAAGALGLLAVLGVVLTVLAPGGAYLTSLPALAGAFAGLAALPLRAPLQEHAVWLRVGLTVLGAVVAVVVLVPPVLLFFPALGLATAGAPALVAGWLGLALLPVLEWLFPDPTRRRTLLAALPVTACVLAAAGAVGAGLALDRLDAAHPAPAMLVYALDTGTGEARWASTDPAPGPWTAGYVAGGPDLAADFPMLAAEGALTTGTAPAAPLPPPAVTTLEDATVDGLRTLRLRVVPQRPVRLLYLGVADIGQVTGAAIAGRELPFPDSGPPTDEGPWGVQFHAPPPEGVEVVVRLRAGGDPPVLRVLDGSDGLDGLPGFAPRPAGTTAAGSHLTDLVVVGGDLPIPAVDATLVPEP